MTTTRSPMRTRRWPPPISACQGLTDEELEARAVLREAIDVAAARMRETLDEADRLAELAFDLALLASERAREADRWGDAAIRYARELAVRVDSRAGETP